MTILETYTQVEAELAETAAYDGNVTLAQRRLAALRRKIDFAETSDQNGAVVTFNHEVVERQIAKLEDFLAANAPDTLDNASVIHTDFATFGGYAG